MSQFEYRKALDRIHRRTNTNQNSKNRKRISVEDLVIMEKNSSIGASVDAVENLFFKLDEQIGSLSRCHTARVCSRTNEDSQPDWREIKKLSECLQRKLDTAAASSLFTEKLQHLMEVIEIENPEPFKLHVDRSEWECVDGATQFYNALMVANNKYLSWVNTLNELMTECQCLQSFQLNESKQEVAEIICDFTNEQITLSKHQIVRVLRIEGNKALVCTDAADGSSAETGLLQVLKQSIQQTHGFCSNCRHSDDAVHMPPNQYWVPRIYLQPQCHQLKSLTDEWIEVKNLLVTLWDEYLKQTGQLIMYLLFSTFKRWNEDKNANEFFQLHQDMQESLKTFFATLENSLADDWECEIHYELILQQLGILQENISKQINSGNSEESLGRKVLAERVGKLALEKQIIFKLLEKYEIMMSFVEKLRKIENGPISMTPLASNVKPKKSFKLFESSKQEKIKPTTSKSEPVLRIKNASSKKVDSKQILDAFLPPPSPSAKTVISVNSLRKVGDKKKQRNRSASEDFKQTNNLSTSISEALQSEYAYSLDGANKYVLIRSTDPRRNKGINESSLLKSKQLGSHIRSFSDVGCAVKTGYVILVKPNLRERITAVYDTANKCQMSVYTAFRRGIVGFTRHFTEDEINNLSEKEQMTFFYAIDTAQQKRLTFHEAVKNEILHYDSSANDPAIFTEFAASEWSGEKTVYRPLVYRIERVYALDVHNATFRRNKKKWYLFADAIQKGLLDKKSADVIVALDTKDSDGIYRIPFLKAVACGIIKAVPLRHCLIDKLPGDNCIFVNRI